MGAPVLNTARLRRALWQMNIDRNREFFSKGIPRSRQKYFLPPSIRIGELKVNPTPLLRKTKARSRCA
jgi:hypothetical protein